MDRVYRGSLRPLFEDDANLASERCTAAKELVSRWLNEQLARECVLTQPAAVKQYLQIHFARQEHESFAVLFLDAQNRLIVATDLFRGTLTQTSVYPREVVKEALLHNAASVIVSHNHPSGVAEPSVQDQCLTRALADALALVDVRVLDHLVVAGTSVVSFAERGLL